MKRRKSVNRLIRTSVIVGCIGLFCILLFLLAGFQAWSVGVGVFLGFPVLLAALVMYIVAVARDLKKHDVIHD
ncbi:hypothetical protein [Pontibacter beigongshangensis]|uniref:hypothetical protein n=1 Tax=Pontibacter beigongshangensis TaxID=2574733 RepID=UPI00164FEE20|nr:hypothetical protein [Pontibacter beigongshangensis]